MNKLSFYLGIYLGIVFILVSQSVYASSTRITEAYVTPQWLSDHLNDKNMVIIDVSLDMTNYIRGHIPNAVFVDWKLDIADTAAKYYQIVTRGGFEKIMSSIGAKPDSRLIFYDNLNNRLAIRALWVAAFYGHENTAILEGGISSWTSKGYMTTDNIGGISATNYSVKNVHSEMRVDKKFVKEHLAKQEVLLVDSRPWKMYTGEVLGKMINSGQEVSRRGHLPGAINIPWKTNITEKNLFIGKENLLKVYMGSGVHMNKKVIFYCNEGVHAVYNWFVVTKVLGFKNTRIYESSIGEWADEPMLPMVSGVGF